LERQGEGRGKMGTEEGGKGQEGGREERERGGKTGREEKGREWKGR